MLFRSFSPPLFSLIVSLAVVLSNSQIANAQGLEFSGAHARVGLHRHHTNRLTREAQNNPSIELLDTRSPPHQPDWRRDDAQFTRLGWSHDSGRNHVNKRTDNARFTRYNAGLGACGAHNSNSDPIVAMSAQDWAGGAHCFDKITITYNGKTVHATIVDECMECPSGALDLSQSLFAQLDDPSKGVIYGSWSYGGGSPPPPSESKPEPKPEPKPSPSPSPKPEPKSSLSSLKPSKTSTHVAPSTTTHASSTLASISLSTATSSSSSATPAVTVSQDDPQVINQLNIAMLYLGGVAVAAAHGTA